MKITIIGAGIGGLATAIGLIREGHEVAVYEQASELGEVGAAVQMSANAAKVLYSLGLKELLEEKAVKPKAFEFRRFDDGELLHEIKLGEKHQELHGVPYYQIHRVDLHYGLLNILNTLDSKVLKLNMRAVSIEESENHVVANFSNGESIASDLLVGADGIKSVVRKLVVDDAPPEFTGQVAWRIAIPTEKIPKELRTDIVSSIWCGPKNHAVMYYMKAGSLLNFVGCVERPWEEESWTSKKPWEELDQDYQGWHPMVRAVIDRVDKDQCFRWALNNRKPVMQWSTNRITLLGDAAHPTLPYMAQGAAMAIEDSAILTRALSLKMPLPDILNAYSNHRAPRTARVVLESNEMADLYHISDPVEMKKAFKDRNIAVSRNEWLYSYDPMHVAII